MKRQTSIIVVTGLLLLAGCDGTDKFGANADHASEEKQYQEYLEMVEELEGLRERNAELEEEVFNLTEYRDSREDAYEYFCEYGYDEISESTYNELCQ
ncbi:hypothetical protein EVJ29_12805 [Exiguobacterium sp. SH4S7]|uniref:hypothetical protein n=1 Tax=Exiguobacterium sp. SH4S7 TaxID=2510958 RepID=UPI001040159C|nr:hypothetical protein [Exiguobacterium sp. SH4S7]TCI34098.1 hypothetical protein EVJ29_12805 [Exiguobacterium sp. SH4S7]